METIPALPHVALPPQPDDVDWPTLAWATGEQLSGDVERLEAVLGTAFDHNPNPLLGRSLALVVVQGGRIVAERYGGGAASTTSLISWSMAKSITHAALGIAIREGLVDLDATPVAPEWSGPGDPRGDITLGNLLEMRSGLRFSEDYVGETHSDCLEMLFGTGAADMAAYAASQPLDHPIDTAWNYSSGTTNIICRFLGSLVGTGPDGIGAFLRRELFDPIGMRCEPRFDDAGTWVGSSYLYATARDFARFGYLYLRDGVWDGRRILPEGWVDDARAARSADPEVPQFYGRHWWMAGDDLGTFWANGYEGQRIMIVPGLDTVIVRLGKTPAEHSPALREFYASLIDALR